MPKTTRKLPTVLALLPLMAVGMSFPLAAYAQTSPFGKCVAPLPPAPGESRNSRDKD